VVKHAVNKGVGGAMVSGYREALELGCTIVVKVDGDGQMDPALLPMFVRPVAEGKADYAKGNRFYNLEDTRQMPRKRLLANLLHSFCSKLSTGYWNIFDPANGYTAIHANVLRHLPLDKISERYFFETDMLFRLGLLRCKVVDIPMRAVYADEVSSFHMRKNIPVFLAGHLRNTAKRIAYNYFLRDFHAASLNLLLGGALTLFGTLFGACTWLHALSTGVATPTGTIMLAALPVLLGLNLLLSFLHFDTQNVPQEIIHDKLA
jgi:dolichol-phosphate mannosyltransferase